MAGSQGDSASGSRSRRDGAAGRRRSRRWPAPARTRRPSGAARYTSAACRIGCPRRGCARPASVGSPGSGLARPRGDLADHAACGQRLPAGLVVVGGVQVHYRLGGQHADHGQGVDRRGQYPIVTTIGRAATVPTGMPCASVTVERFSPCLRRSAGLGPAVWPPQGALVMQPSTAKCSNSKPTAGHRRQEPPA